MTRLREANDILPLLTDREMLHDLLAFAQNKIDEALIIAFNLVEENVAGMDTHRENVKNVKDKLVVLYRDSPFSLTSVLKKLEPEKEKADQVKKMTRGSAKKRTKEEEVVVIDEGSYAQLETSVLGSFELLNLEQKDRLIRSLVTSI